MGIEINEFINIIFSIGRAHIIVIAIVLGSFLLEKLTGLNLFIDHYTWKKSKLNADMLSSRDSVYYFILNVIVFGYDVYKKSINFKIINIILWFIIISVLTKLFYHFHRKYQAVDPNKADDDYT